MFSTTEKRFLDITNLPITNSTIFKFQSIRDPPDVPSSTFGPLTHAFNSFYSRTSEFKIPALKLKDQFQAKLNLPRGRIHGCNHACIRIDRRAGKYRVAREPKIRPI